MCVLNFLPYSLNRWRELSIPILLALSRNLKDDIEQVVGCDSAFALLMCYEFSGSFVQNTFTSILDWSERLAI